MPRTARTVFPDTAHHVVARGVNRQRLFRTGYDKRKYLQRFARLAIELNIQVHAFCLMDNHMHWILTPPSKQALGKFFQRLHTAWAMYYNSRYGRTGHLFQNRYFSSPLDWKHFWTAIRYVEANPMRAGFQGRPEEWDFSSARARLTGKRDEDIVLSLLDWERLYGPNRWREFLGPTWQEQCTLIEQQLRRTIRSSRPCGSDEWLREQELRHGPFRRWRPPGRPLRQLEVLAKVDAPHIGIAAQFGRTS
ncbi:MAG: transposase [Bryobacterales bacterium]|nr:transposase [Bryobacterales bacterium]